MSKEHSGGTPEVGHISLDGWDEESYAVPIEHFDFEALDKPSDFILEAVKKDEDIEPIVQSLVNRVAAIKAAAHLAGAIALILESKKPRMTAHQIVWATGMNLLGGATITELAAKYGVSKQAFQQGAMRLRAKLRLSQSRNMRSDEARENMRLRNYRR